MSIRLQWITLQLLANFLFSIVQFKDFNTKQWSLFIIEQMWDHMSLTEWDKDDICGMLKKKQMQEQAILNKNITKRWHNIVK